MAEEQEAIPKAKQSKLAVGNKRRKKKEEEVELTPEEKAAKAAAARLKFVQDYCTNLVFKNKDGTVTERLLEGERMETYTELQRALARVTPRSARVFMLMSKEGKILTPENFTNANSYIVKEMINAKIEATAKSKFKPSVDLRWEFYDYHGGAPPGWVDKIEVEKKKKELALKAAREREKSEALAAKVMDRLTAGDDDDSDEGGAFDDL
jgi:hypothetical protein